MQLSSIKIIIINNAISIQIDHAILAESLQLSIPAHQNRIISSNRDPTTFNNVSTLHRIGMAIIYHIIIIIWKLFNRTMYRKIILYNNVIATFPILYIIL